VVDLNDPRLWIVNVVAALLAVVNTVSWGFCIREVRDPQLSVDFLLKLIFNRWFIIAMISAFVVALLSYIILNKLGVLAGRFFLTLQLVAITLTATFVLGERPSITTWIGIILIIVGVGLVGYGK